MITMRPHWVLLLALMVLPASPASQAQEESTVIKADRRALEEAIQEGISSKILAAREQLSDDLQKISNVTHMEINRRQTMLELARNADAQRLNDQKGTSVPLRPDGLGHYCVDVLINNKVHASLLVDTGSPVVTLTLPIASQLDLDLSHSQTGHVVLLSRIVTGALTSLELKVGNLRAADVQTVVLLQHVEGAGDGILGLSFLSQFHFTLDERNQRLILRR